jgi:hypothetical protein
VFVENAIAQENLLYPFTRDTLNQYADSLTLTGKIEYYSGVAPQCGIMCTAAVLVFKLTEQSQNYPHSHVYVAFTCSHTVSKKDRKKTILVKLKKIAIDDYSCFWQERRNPFDTKGWPFYHLVGYTVQSKRSY